MCVEEYITGQLSHLLDSYGYYQAAALDMNSSEVDARSGAHPRSWVLQGLTRSHKVAQPGWRPPGTFAMDA